MLNSGLAALYQVETGTLNSAVKRNISRFPEDFRFQLTKEEYQNLKCQTGISSFAQDENNYGGRRTLPHVFTEQGIAMLASVLHSEVAISINFVHFYLARNRIYSTVKMATIWLIIKKWRSTRMSKNKIFVENYIFSISCGVLIYEGR